MDRVSIRTLFIVLGIAELYLGVVPKASACCLTDWMFRRRQTPVTANYGAAPAFPPPVAAAYPAPVAAAAPTTGCCGPGQCEETVVRYVPEMAYRTVWQPVPVTTYRRTVSYNPATGLPITCTQPCTTYTYQARRVPYTSFRPVYTTVPISAPATTIAPTPIPTTGCNSCPPSAVPAFGSYPATGSPYSAAPAGMPTGVPSGAPVSADPPGATPWQPVGPAVGAPSSGSEWTPAYNGSTTTPDPADQKPRIDPDVNNGLSSMRRPPTTAPRSTWTSSDAYKAPNPTDPWPTPADPATGAGGGAVTDPPATLPPTLPQGVRPLPSVDGPAPGSFPQPPPLLNSPRDHTATIRPIPTQWASSPIAWPERLAQHTVDVTTTKTQPAIRPATERRLETRRLESPPQRFDSDSNTSPAWDQSGWRSAQR